MTTMPSLNPYVGPRTFTREDHDRFFGREQEARELLSRVVSQRLVLFYAQSGAGKSSLVNTRLIPQLEKAGFAALPVGRVGGEAPSGIGPVDNIFLFNLMLRLDASNQNPARLAHLPLADFLAGLTSDDGKRWYYDSALTEEAKGREEEQRKRETTAAAKTKSDDMEQGQFVAPNYVLIIDQFEEIITTNVDRWTERKDFFSALETAMLADPKLWVVLVLREDYVAALDPYAALMTDKLRARYYMQRMDVNAALAAIQEPAKVYGHPFAPDVAEKLVDDLRRIKVLGQTTAQLGQYVEPVQLQVVCYQLWENLAKQRPLVAGAVGYAYITAADLAAAGDVDTALARFYEETLASVLAVAETPVSERQLRTWFDSYLITPAGTRGLVLQGAEETGGLPNDIVHQLQARFLVRSESRAGGSWIELVHDRFVAPIRESNKLWFPEHLSTLQRQAALWEQQGRSSGLLLRDDALVEAEAWAVAHAGALAPYEADFLTRCREAKAVNQRQQQQQQRIRILAIIASVIGVVALLAAIVAWTNARQAQVEKGRADQQANLAGTREAEAAMARGTAEANAREAEQQQQKAEDNAAIARSAEAIARSRQLAAQSASELAHNHYEPAILLAIESGRVTDTFEAFAAIRAAIANPWHSRVLLQGHTASVVQATWSPDESKIVTASDDKTARIWDAATGKQLVKLAGHTDRVVQATWSPDESKIVTASDDKTARIWDAVTGQELVKLAGHTRSVRQATWSQDASKILTASGDGTARIWDAATGQQLVKLAGHTDRVTQASWSPDESKIVTASDDKTVRIWDAATGQQLVRLAGHTASVKQATWSQDESKVLTSSDDGTARIWDAATGKELVKLAGHTDRVGQASWSRDASKILTASADYTARIWDAATGKELVKLAGHTWDVNQASWSQDASKILTASADGTACIWDAVTGQELVKLAGHTVYQATWSRDASKILAASADYTARIWDAATGKELVKLAGHTDWVGQATWSRDESKILTRSNDYTARIWDAATGQELVKLAGHTWGVNQATWSRDESKILTASGDYTARIWDAATGQELVKLAGHTASVWQATWSQDESKILTRSADGTARIWDAATGQELVKLAGHTDGVYQATWSKDESKILTSSADNTVRIWYVRMQDLLSAACRWTPRNMSANEWSLYMEGPYRPTCPTVILPLDAIGAMQEKSSALVRQGDYFSVTQMLKQLNGWLKQNGQWSSFGIQPAQLVANVAAELARSGEITMAMATYQDALRLDPGLDIDPEVVVQVEFGRGLASRGAYTETMNAFATVHTISPTFVITTVLEANEWNSLCWNGSLAGAAAAVLPACERVVALAPKDGGIYDSRGLARALTGNTDGAIADFGFAVQWAEQGNRGTAFIESRRLWIAALKSGKNPFDAVTLAALKTEQ